MSSISNNLHGRMLPEHLQRPFRTSNASSTLEFSHAREGRNKEAALRISAKEKRKKRSRRMPRGWMTMSRDLLARIVLSLTL